MLGLSRPAVKYRSNEHQDFPEPMAHLRSGPVWLHADILAYARERSRVFYEQPGVKFLARHGVPNREPAVVTRKRQGGGQWEEQLDEIIKGDGQWAAQFDGIINGGSSHDRDS